MALRVPFRTSVWIIISLWIYLLTDVCVRAHGLRSLNTRQERSPQNGFVTTNRLAESDTASPINYEELLEKINGNFGIKSDVLKATEEEPQYHGTDTRIVPLYIPEGAVPINLARIPRSGNQDKNEDFVDMKVSPSSHSVLMPRMGTVAVRRTFPPRRTGWRQNKRGEESRLPLIRMSDLIRFTPRTTTPQVPSLLHGFGQRISPPRAAPSPIANRRLSPDHSLPFLEDEDTEDIKRAKKNELSKVSQFHNSHTTEPIGGASSSTSKTPTSTSTTTFAKPSSIIKFPKRPESSSTTVKLTSTTAKSTTTSTTKAPTTTTKTTTTTTPVPKPKTTTPNPTNATPKTTTALKIPATSTEAQFKAKETILTDSDATSTQSTAWDRRSVLFPKPVKSIIRNIESDSTIETTPSTTTEKLTTSKSSSTIRTPAATLRILPPWLTRSSSSTTERTLQISSKTTKSTTTTSTTTTTEPTLITSKTPIKIEKPPIVRLRGTRRPIRTTTEKAISTERSTTQQSMIRLSTTTSTEGPTSTTKRMPVITRRPKTPSTLTLSTTQKPPITLQTTTEISTTSTTTSKTPTSNRSFENTKRPAIIPQRSSPVKMMLSVGEILKDTKNTENMNDTDKTPTNTEKDFTRSSFVTPATTDFDKENNKSSSSNGFDDRSFSTTTVRNINRERIRPSIFSDTSRQENIPVFDDDDTDDNDNNDDKQKNILSPSNSDTEREENIAHNQKDMILTTTPVSVKEDIENKSPTPETTTEETIRHSSALPIRKVHRHRQGTRLENENGRRENDAGRPHRRRRPGRYRTTTASPVTQVSNLKRNHDRNTSYGTEKEDTETTRKINFSTKPTIKISATTFPTPIITTEKSPEQVVIESLTEIMKDATNSNKGKDKVSNIATHLEALNKRLAERGITIMQAEVDGVRIKLDNRTLARYANSPLVTTFRPSTAFKVTLTPTYTTTTENPPTSLSYPPAATRNSPTIEDDVPEEAEKDVLTSIQTSFSVHTIKPTDLDNETDSENEVHSTTNDSDYTTFKPVDIRKQPNKPIRGDSLGPLLAPSSENFEGSSTVNKSRVEANPKTPVVEENISPVRTSSSSSGRDKEEETSSKVPSVGIFATSTIPVSVTTRTRSTTVPLTNHRSFIRPFFSNPKDRQERPTVSEDISPVNGKETLRNEDLIDSGEHPNPADIHPTSHHRPTSVPVDDTASDEPYDNTFSYATIIEDTPLPSLSNSEEKSSSKATTTTSTTRRPIIKVISITEEIKNVDNSPTSFAASENVKNEDFAETSSSASTTIYVIGVIGIIPAAGLAVLLAKKFLRKTQKALPDSEERAEGFTPVTHHSRKPSQTNTLDVEPSSVEAKNPKYSPWEFPRSKLRLVSILGEGNFGVVWKAEARELCACEGAPGATVLVAVKGVKDGAGLKERQDLLKELGIMQQIGQHPNVVTLLGCCTQQEPHHLVMEYVMFGKLLTFLRDNRTRQNYFNFSSDTEALTSKDLTRFACQIATGCDYLQTRGIIHRDLAARNILVDHNKVCKIADFGLARNIKDLGSDIYEQKSRGALPIRWMAPESLYMSIFTHKSDVWSLGILCWEIVTLGSTPYPGMTAREVMRRVREGYRLVRPDHCRPEFYHIVTKCWHQDLNKRPTFAELKVEMAQLLEHSQTAYPCIDLENFPEANYFSMHDNEDEKL